MKDIVLKGLDTVLSYREEGWILTAPNGRRAAFVDRKDPFLPILERSFRELELAFDDGSGRSTLEVFPYVDLLRFGIQSESEYWQRLALERLVECGNPEEFIDDLRRLKTSGLSQENRHLAAKALRMRTGGD